MLTTEDNYLDEKLVTRTGVVKKKQSVLSRLVTGTNRLLLYYTVKSLIFMTYLLSHTAVGNFSVQYNFQAISIALLVMAASVCTTDDEDCKEGTQAEWVSSTATATVFVGAITGQLTVSSSVTAVASGLNLICL
jgi:hypothetical protein